MRRLQTRLQSRLHRFDFGGAFGSGMQLSATAGQSTKALDAGAQRSLPALWQSSASSGPIIPSFGSGNEV
jgi:hypothetical protein